MIVTIDGPAGAGKSSISRALAERLGFVFLDTGAMYRAVALAGLRAGIDWGRPDDLARLTRQLRMELQHERTLLDGADVSQEIRTREVTAHIFYAADNPAVREHLVSLQRQAAAGRDVVTEGRDQGTVAFPEAECKIFLTASPLERARRRLAELQLRGEEASLDDILAQQNERDRRDSTRAVGRLLKADDAIEVVTDGLAPEEVVERLLTIVRKKPPSGRDG